MALNRNLVVLVTAVILDLGRRLLLICLFVLSVFCVLEEMMSQSTDGLQPRSEEVLLLKEKNGRILITFQAKVECTLPNLKQHFPF